MARLYCLECHTVVGESVGDWHGDTGAGFGFCQTCGQHGGISNARAAARSGLSSGAPKAPPSHIVTPSAT
jgi:hypothetical protein